MWLMQALGFLLSALQVEEILKNLHSLISPYIQQLEKLADETVSWVQCGVWPPTSPAKSWASPAGLALTLARGELVLSLTCEAGSLGSPRAEVCCTVHAGTWLPALPEPFQQADMVFSGVLLEARCQLGQGPHEWPRDC